MTVKSNLIKNAGVSSERRTNEMKRLNQAYLEVLNDRKGLAECLEYMVETESYRWICNATYSIDPKPLHSQRTVEVEPQTTIVEDTVQKLLLS